MTNPFPPVGGQPSGREGPPPPRGTESVRGTGQHLLGEAEDPWTIAAKALQETRQRQDVARARAQVAKAAGDDLSKVPTADLVRTFVTGTGQARTAAGLEIAVRYCAAAIPSATGGKQ